MQATKQKPNEDSYDGILPLDLRDLEYFSVPDDLSDIESFEVELDTLKSPELVVEKVNQRALLELSKNHQITQKKRGLEAEHSKSVEALYSNIKRFFDSKRDYDHNAGLSDFGKVLKEVSKKLDTSYTKIPEFLEDDLGVISYLDWLHDETQELSNLKPQKNIMEPSSWYVPNGYLSEIKNERNVGLFFSGLLSVPNIGIILTSFFHDPLSALQMFSEMGLAGYAFEATLLSISLLPVYSQNKLNKYKKEFGPYEEKFGSEYTQWLAAENPTFEEIKKHVVGKIILGGYKEYLGDGPTIDPELDTPELYLERQTERILKETGMIGGKYASD